MFSKTLMKSWFFIFLLFLLSFGYIFIWPFFIVIITVKFLSQRSNKEFNSTLIKKRWEKRNNKYLQNNILNSPVNPWKEIRQAEIKGAKISEFHKLKLSELIESSENYRHLLEMAKISSKAITKEIYLEEAKIQLNKITELEMYEFPIMKIDYNTAIGEIEKIYSDIYNETVKTKKKGTLKY